MTALLVVEQHKLGASVTIDRAAEHEAGIGLRAGEKFHVKDLLAAALIASANNACRALADAAAGSEANFVRQMNERAQRLGLRDTQYANACGRNAVQQHTSAHDLTLLAHELLRHPEITALTARPGARIATLDGRRSFRFDSRNALIGRYRGALGLKTGYTRKAGKCQVIYAERGKDKVLLVMLHGRRWGDAADILDLAFDHARH
jgi:serine-type D-Ala-D-Ala carboxypeptidase (penicillin-binding protein 5/6)